MTKRFTIEFYTYRVGRIRPGTLVDFSGPFKVFSAGGFRRAFAVVLEVEPRG